MGYISIQCIMHVSKHSIASAREIIRKRLAYIQLKVWHWFETIIIIIDTNALFRYWILIRNWSINNKNLLLFLFGVFSFDFPFWFQVFAVFSLPQSSFDYIFIWTFVTIVTFPPRLTCIVVLAIFSSFPTISYAFLQYFFYLVTISPLVFILATFFIRSCIWFHFPSTQHFNYTFSSISDCSYIFHLNLNLILVRYFVCFAFW